MELLTPEKVIKCGWCKTELTEPYTDSSGRHWCDKDCLKYYNTALEIEAIIAAYCNM